MVHKNTMHNHCTTNKLSKNSNFSRISQASTEYLILIALIVLVLLIVSYVAFSPKKDVSNQKAFQVADSIADAANRAATLGPGNVVSIVVDIPKSVSSLTFDDGGISMMYSDGNSPGSDYYKPLQINLTGYSFSSGNTSKSGSSTLLFESMGDGVCIYPPGKRKEYCSCFDTNRPSPSFINMTDPELHLGTQSFLCTVYEQIPGVVTDDMAMVCSSFTLQYGRILSGISSMCTAENGFVMYRIYDRTNALIYEGKAKESNGYYNLTNIRVPIEKSGLLKIEATCYDSCYAVNSKREALFDKEEISVTVPPGIICPYFIDAEGNKYYSWGVNQRCRDTFMGKPKVYFNDTLGHQALINASGGNPYNNSRLKEDTCSVIRSGYDCIYGECLNVNATMLHTPSGY